MKGHVGSVWTIAAEEEGDELFSGGSDGTIRLWERWPSGWESVRVLPGLTGGVTSLALCEGKLLAAGGSPGLPLVGIWERPNLRCLRKLKFPSEFVPEAIVPWIDGAFVACGQSLIFWRDLVGDSAPTDVKDETTPKNVTPTLGLDNSTDASVSLVETLRRFV